MWKEKEKEQADRYPTTKKIRKKAAAKRTVKKVPVQHAGSSKRKCKQFIEVSG